MSIHLPLTTLFPFFEKERHAISLTSRFEGLFRDFEFQGLTIRGPCTSASKQSYACSQLDTSTPHQLLWIPSHNEEKILYFYDIDFTNETLYAKILMVYETIVIGNSGAQLIPLHDFILPHFPSMTPHHLLPLSSLQLYGCIFTQSMLDAIGTFPVRTLVLTGYAYAEHEEAKNTLLIHARVRVLMLSLLSRWPVTLNLSQVPELDYWALGGAISVKNNITPNAPHEQLMTCTLSDLYTVAEGYRTNVKTLALLLSASDLVCRSMKKLFGSVDRIGKIILGYNTCGIQCPLRSMQHCVSSAGMPVEQISSLNAPTTNDKEVQQNVLLAVFELCGEKGIRHFALDRDMSAHMERRPFAAFAPYIDTMECEFMGGDTPSSAKTPVRHLPTNYGTVSDFEVFCWSEAVLSSGKSSQRLIPISGKAQRVILIDPRLEWLGSSYIVVNRSNDVSLPKDGVTLLDEKTQRSMIRSAANASSSWWPSLPWQ